MDDDRLNLSALDPMREPEHWQSAFDSTLARVDAVLRERERRQDPLVLIAGWMRPLLAAAAVTVAILIPMEIALEKNEINAERVQLLVTFSMDWAHGEQQPTGTDLLRVLSGVEVQ